MNRYGRHFLVPIALDAVRVIWSAVAITRVSSSGMTGICGDQQQHCDRGDDRVWPPSAQVLGVAVGCAMRCGGQGGIGSGGGIAVWRVAGAVLVWSGSVVGDGMWGQATGRWCRACRAVGL